MASNEIRKDYLLNRWVVIAKERKKRPTDFIKNRIVPRDEKCPLCPGNEHMTPPAVLVYLSVNGKIEKECDRKDFIHKNWLVRVVPNLYPVFDPLIKKKLPPVKNNVSINALGHHEVIVESPCHSEHPGVARVSQIVHVINTYLDRLTTLSRKSYVKHISIFRNHGGEAGASLSHAHTQLIASPIIPSLIEGELSASKDYWNKNQDCLLCVVINKEKDSPRFIWENNSFLVFAPWASINPLEFWILPKRHNSNILSISERESTDFAATIRVCLGGLRSYLNDPPYNFGLHTVLGDQAENCYHWHLEVYPRLTIWAGFEKSTGMFINTISPEDSAKVLRSKFIVEKENLD
jgi:UDPglucose--hexose-1-phosphate uridylyltransferase